MADPITIDQYFLYTLPTISSTNQVLITKKDQQDFKGVTAEPVWQVSQLTKLFQHNALPKLPVFFGKEQATNTLTQKLVTTDMYSYYPGAFKLLDTVYLEISAITWHLDNAPVALNNISKKDIRRIRYNLQVLADWCGNYEEYYHFITKLRQLDVDLGMIENKINYIVNHYGYTR